MRWKYLSPPIQSFENAMIRGLNVFADGRNEKQDQLNRTSGQVYSDCHHVRRKTPFTKPSFVTCEIANVFPS